MYEPVNLNEYMETVNTERYQRSTLGLQKGEFSVNESAFSLLVLMVPKPTAIVVGPETKGN
jgi:hypothetical protein